MRGHSALFLLSRPACAAYHAARPLAANDNEAPESWLEWVGWRKFVFGFGAHRRWHYTGPLGQPRRYVRWYIRSSAAPPPETLLNLLEAARAWATGTDPEWTVEADEAEAEEAPKTKPDGASHDGSAAPASSDTGSATSSVASAIELRNSKRRHMVVGLVGVYVTWAIFAWFIFVYGMLIYKLLGDSAQQEFARSWGVSYGMNAATEWKARPSLQAASCAALLPVCSRAVAPLRRTL